MYRLINLILRIRLLPIFACFLTANAFAGVVFTSYPSDDSSYYCAAGGNQTAVGVLTPSGTRYQIDSIAVRLYGNQPSVPYSVDLYSNNGGVPGFKITTIGSGITNGNSVDDYVITPSSPVPLLANSTYWILLSGTYLGSCDLGWEINGTNPTGGIFDFVGQEININQTGWAGSGSYQTLEIDASVFTASQSVSIPTLNEWGMILLSSLLALGAVFALRRWRR